jgi:hypothetical protein
VTKRFHVVDHKKTIRDRRNKAFVKVKTFDMKVMTGSKPIGVLVDERDPRLRFALERVRAMQQSHGLWRSHHRSRSQRPLRWR